MTRRLGEVVFPVSRKRGYCALCCSPFLQTWESREYNAEDTFLFKMFFFVLTLCVSGLATAVRPARAEAIPFELQQWRARQSQQTYRRLESRSMVLAGRLQSLQ
jgi:hypothetical protein